MKKLIPWLLAVMVLSACANPPVPLEDVSPSVYKGGLELLDFFASDEFQQECIIALDHKGRDPMRKKYHSQLNNLLGDGASEADETFVEALKIVYDQWADLWLTMECTAWLYGHSTIVGVTRPQEDIPPEALAEIDALRDRAEEISGYLRGDDLAPLRTLLGN